MMMWNNKAEKMENEESQMPRHPAAEVKSDEDHMETNSAESPPPLPTTAPPILAPPISAPLTSAPLPLSSRLFRPIKVQVDESAPTTKSSASSDEAPADRQHLSARHRRQRRKSPVTVQEWVAALPDVHAEAKKSIRRETKPCEPVESDPPNQSSNESIEVPGIDDDNLTLGAEASIVSHGQVSSSPPPHVVPSINRTNQVPLNSIPVDVRRRILLQTHEKNSFQSDVSARTVSSVDSVLFSREVDPTELLMDLGFGGPPTSVLARIPARFLQPSQAKGISLEEFLRRQDDFQANQIEGDGFRGLPGLKSPSRPSHLNPKPPLGRFAHVDSLASIGSSSRSPSLAAIVGHARINQSRDSPAALRGARAFRAAAQSVLSPANRKFIQEQESRPSSVTKMIRIGSETIAVNEDGLTVNDPVENISDESLDELDDLRSFVRPALHKRDSELSMQSSCSVDSDWSDEELEELERIFGSIQEKSALRNEGDVCSESSEVLRHENAVARWKHLKLQRTLAMKRVKMGQRRSSSSLTLNSTGTGSSSVYYDALNGSEMGSTIEGYATPPVSASLIFSCLEEAQEEGESLASAVDNNRAEMSQVIFTDNETWRRRNVDNQNTPAFTDDTAVAAQHIILTQSDHRIPRRFSRMRM